jgi:hypothetical protein
MSTTVKQITDLEYINSLLNNMSKHKELPVLINIYGLKKPGKIYFLYKKKGELSIELITEDPLPVGSIVSIDISFNNIFFTFNSSIIEVTSNGYKITKPGSINAMFSRILARYKVDENEEIYADFQCYKKEYKLTEVTTKGMSFTCSEDFLYHGQIVRNIKVKVPDGEAIVDAEVRHYKQNPDGTYTYGMKFFKTSFMSIKNIFNYIFKKTHPDLYNIENLTIEEIYSLYSNEKPDDEFMQKVEKLHEVKNRPAIFSSVLHCKNDKVIGLGSMMRVYSKTALKQQSVTMPEGDLNLKAKVDMYSGMADIILNRPYFEYSINYIGLDYFWNDIFAKVI